MNVPMNAPVCPWCKQELIDCGAGWLDQVGEGFSIPARIWRCRKDCHQVEVILRETQLPEIDEP